MIDYALQLSIAPPAAGGNATINLLDLGIDQPGFSNQWRQGRLRIAWPAMPNLTSNADNITISLQDSADGVTFANTGATVATTPIIQVQIPGVATNGVAAGYCDVPIPPMTRGPIGLYLAATAGAGNNTAAGLITASWLNE